MVFMTSAMNKIERLLLARGFAVERGNRAMRVRTNHACFTRKQHDEVLKVIDRYGANVNFPGPILITKRGILR